MLRELLTALGGLIFRRAGAAERFPRDHRAQRASKTAGGSEGGVAMNAAYERLIQHLDGHNVRYATDVDERSIYADFTGEVGTYRIVARVDAEDHLFQVFGLSPVRVPQGARADVAETLTRANFGLKVGKFELDYDQGDLRFQTSQILADENLEDETIQRLMGTVMAMLNMYLPAVLSVIYGNELPKDAVRLAEPPRQGPKEPDRGDA